MSEFEKNVLKRKGMEERKKKRAEEEAEYKEIADEKKWEKMMRVTQTQKRNADALTKKQQELDKRWRNLKKRPGQSHNQEGFFEQMQAIKDANNIRLM